MQSIPISFSTLKSFQAETNTILIIQIETLESRILSDILEHKEKIKNKIIIIIRSNNALLVSSLIKLGFDDIFVFPYEIVKFNEFLKALIQDRGYLTVSGDETFDSLSDNLDSIIGYSGSFRRVINLAKKVSEKSSSNILLLGETGTGKGLFAKAIHNNSKVRREPFVDIVCTAIPESLLESELFGYEPGAFTNARHRKIGLFELAGSGTLFLDEIGDMSINLQAKLLRAIEKKVIKRLGGVVDIPINARIISATNKNLEEMVEENSFRRDLYHRLNVVTIELPPLKERGEDIIKLANHFIDHFNKEFSKSVRKIEKELKHFFLGYPWPGNVRELKNAIERAVLLSDDSRLTLQDFSNLISSVPVGKVTVNGNQELPPQYIRLDLNYAVTDLRKLEKFYARSVYERVGENKTQTAKLLGISRPKLDALLSN